MTRVPSSEEIERRASAESLSMSTRLAELDWLLRLALIVGVVALVPCVIGAAFAPRQFFRSYLVAHQFWLGIALGSMAILMLFHLTGGAWGYMIRRFLEAAMRTLPLMALLFTPIAIGVVYLYPWADPEVVAGNRELRYNHIYLNAPFFWGRAALFFILWIVLAFVLSAWSREQDVTGEPHLPRKFRLLSAPGLVIYGVTITFASIDWVMSLQPTFHSTIFAPIYATGQLLSGMALALIVLAWFVFRPPLREVISQEVMNDLGNLLFTFLILWAYMTFFQFMLVWIANLREEVVWYQPRSVGGWQWVAWALFVFHFAVPFFLLLMRDIKRDPTALAKVAGLLLSMQLVFMFFQIEPAFPNTTMADHWMDFLAPVGVGGLWLAYFLWQLRRRPLLALHDLNREAAADFRRADLESSAREEETQHG